MSAVVEKALQALTDAAADGRLAHAYLIQGSPEGAGRALAERLLVSLFCETGPARACGVCFGCRQAKVRRHPDLMWLEPESRSRRFPIEIIRRLNHFVFQQSYCGGWKVAVILCADRLVPAAAHAFLKTLEEPPSKALFLLISDSPGEMLLTVRSRCQRILLPTEAAPERAWTAPLIELLAADPWQDTLSRLRFAAQFAVLIEAQRVPSESGPSDDEDSKAIREAREAAYLRQVRTEILGVMACWARDVYCVVQGLPDDVLHFPMQAETIRRQAHGLRSTEAMDRVRACERLGKLLECNLKPNMAALAALLDPAALGPGRAGMTL